MTPTEHTTEKAHLRSDYCEGRRSTTAACGATLPPGDVFAHPEDVTCPDCLSTPLAPTGEGCVMPERAQGQTDRISIITHPEVRLGRVVQRGHRVDCKRSGLALFLTDDELADLARLATERLGYGQEANYARGYADGFAHHDGPSLADAWDEGYAAGIEDSMDGRPQPNPHRVAMRTPPGKG